MDTTSYVVRFVAIMTLAVAFVLALLSTGWKGAIKQNEAIFNKRAILSSVSKYLDSDPAAMTDEQVLSVFSNNITQVALNMKGEKIEAAAIEAAGYKGGLPESIDMAKEKKKPESDRIFPLFVFKGDKGTSYILSVRGNGLWDEIWGNIALKDDLKTIVGASFDHKGETPGLGAEIKDNPTFPARFQGKQIFDANGAYTSVAVLKNVGSGNPHAVDGISGATVTCQGVSEMLDRSISNYLPYFKQIKK